MTHKVKETVFITVLLLVAFALLIYHSNNMWLSLHESVRVWVAGGVRNLNLYGYDVVGLVPTRNTAPIASPLELQYYTHHPPLLIWIPALLTRMYGFHELGMRLPFIFATLISIAAFYVLARRLYGWTFAAAATTFYVMTPFTTYLGRVPGHDPLAFMALLLFAAVFVNWLRKPTTPRYFLLMLLTILAAWTAWPAVFFVTGLGLVGFVMGQKQHRLGVIVLYGVTGMAVVVMMALYEVQQAGAITSLIGSFFLRISSATSHTINAPSFTLGNWFVTNVAHLIFLATVGLTILAIWGVFVLWRYGQRRQNMIISGMFLSGLAYLVVFRNASYIHDYYKAFLVPAMALSAGAVWHFIRNGTRQHRRLKPLVDSFIIAGIVNALAVFALLIYTGYQPAIIGIIDYLNNQNLTDERIIISHEDFEATTDYFINYEHVIEFYSSQAIDWNVPIETALEQTQSNPILYIRCETNFVDDLPALFQDKPYETVYPEKCFAFKFN